MRNAELKTTILLWLALVGSGYAQDIVTGVVTDEGGRPGTVAPTDTVTIITDTLPNVEFTLPSDYADADAAIDPVSDTGTTDDGLSSRRPRSQEELGTMSREELFALAFGGAAPARPRDLIMRLFVEDRSFGNTDIVYEADFSSFQFISERLSQYLDTLLLPEARAAAGDTSGLFNSASLEAAGYELSVDETMFELRIAAPAEAKRMQRMNLGGGYRRVPRGEPLEPARVSFYMNYMLNDRLTYTFNEYAPAWAERNGLPARHEVYGRTPAIFTSDGALTSLGWTLEGSVSITEPREGEDFTWGNVNRGDIWLSRDILPLNSRVYLGELDLNNDLMGGGAILGARYEHSGWFFNDDPHDERNSVTFFIPRAGTVELYINDRYTDRFTLPAGHHQIGGFDGNVGHNKVRLVVRMVDGSVEDIPFEFIQSDPRNLPKGDMHYTVAAGFRRDDVPAPVYYDYDFEDPAMSAYVMYGLHHLVSVGVSGTGSRHGGIAGAHALFSMGEWGTSHLRLFSSYAGDEGFGGRAELNVTPNFKRAVETLCRMMIRGMGVMEFPNMSFSARAYYQSRFYNTNVFARLIHENAEMFGTSGNLSVRLFNGMISANGGVNFINDTTGRGGHSVAGYDYGVRASQSVHKFSFSASAGINVIGERRSPYFTVGSNYAIGGRIKKHRFSASSNFGTRYVDIQPTRRLIVYPDSVRNLPDFDEQQYPQYEEVGGDHRYDWALGAQAGWRYATGGPVGQTYSANVRVPNMFDGFAPGVRAGLYHNYNRGRLSADYNMTNNSSLNRTAQTHSLNATFAGSLMFADGMFALGRPVQGQGGFILAGKGYGMEAANIHVDRSRIHSHDFSKTGWLGAAYKNSMDAYQPTQMTLTLTNAPVGAPLPNNLFYAPGGYKQGYKLRIGGKANVMMLVKFTADGKPLSHVYATIEPESGGEFGRQVTFTGADGVLQAGGLRRGGTYRIKFAQPGIKDTLITIPRDAELIYEPEDIAAQIEGIEDSVPSGDSNDDGWGDDDGGWGDEE